MSIVLIRKFLPTLLVLFILMALFAASIPSPVRADVAPPPAAAGANPSPGYQAPNVRMVAETVDITVAAESPKEFGQAQVVADFQMRNLGDAEEKMQARFPLDKNTFDTDVYPMYPSISDFAVWIDGKTVPVTNTYEDLNNFITGKMERVATWANFPADFPVLVHAALRQDRTQPPHQRSSP